MSEDSQHGVKRKQGEASRRLTWTTGKRSPHGQRVEDFASVIKTSLGVLGPESEAGHLWTPGLCIN